MAKTENKVNEEKETKFTYRRVIMDNQRHKLRFRSVCPKCN